MIALYKEIPFISSSYSKSLYYVMCKYIGCIYIAPAFILQLAKENNYTVSTTSGKVGKYEYKWSYKCLRLRNITVVDAESKRCPLTEWWEQLCVFPSFFWIEELTVENDTHSPLPFCYPGRNLLPLIIRHSLLTDLFLIDSFPAMWILPSYGEIHRKMSSFCHSVGRQTKSMTHYWK